MAIYTEIRTPSLIAKDQRRLPGFVEKVIALYARGMTTREIQGHLKELYKVEVSPSLISTVSDAVLGDVKAWQSRPLDALHVKMRASGHVQTQAVYLALALTLEGEKELLGMWVGEAEGAKFWLDRDDRPAGPGSPAPPSPPPAPHAVIAPRAATPTP